MEQQLQQERIVIENDDEKTIITRADELLYEAKRSGKNKVMS